MADPFYVYVHSRLGSGEPFYVGKGRGPRAYKSDSRRPHWRSIVAKEGGFHTSFVARNLDEEFAFLLEMELISKLRRAGVRLANVTDGGDGVSGYRNPNGAPNKGIPCSPEMKARISRTLKEKGCLPPIGWNRGQQTPDDIRAKMSASQRERWANIQANGGVVVSAETRAKQSASALGRKWTPEQRIAKSKAMKADPKIKARGNNRGRRG